METQGGSLMKKPEMSATATGSSSNNKKINTPTRILPSSTLQQLRQVIGVDKNSHTISKCNYKKPKIRIIHIFAPEIIKTDAANFRELVQRLTGKPPEDDDETETKKKNGIKGEDEIWSGGADSNNLSLGGFGEFDECGLMHHDLYHYPFLEPSSTPQTLTHHHHSQSQLA